MNTRTTSTKGAWIQLNERRATRTAMLLLLLLILPVWGAQGAVVFTTLYSFTGTNDGGNPTAALVQGSDGYFYGTTYGGGTNGYGTVFKISTNGVFTSLYSFTGTNDGANPRAVLVLGSDGGFYGTTSGGDNSGDGTVFKISTNGALTTLHSFDGTDGANPTAALVQGSDGNFYGTTGGGGTNGYGTVFKINTNGVLTSLYSFGSVQDTDGVRLDGAYPYAALVQGNDGNFYGTTGGGGTIDRGTVFKISTNGALTSLHSFIRGDGLSPNGLVQGSDGYFYGTTFSGGVRTNPFGEGCGTVCKINTNGVLTSLYSFGSVQDTNRVALDGSSPYAPMVQGSDGSFYGMTGGGGTYGYGTVFRLTIVPGLSIIPSGPYVILTWPTNYAGFSYAGYTLQSTTNLGSSAVWTTNSSPPVVIGGDNVVINTMSGRQQFYRLSR